MSAIPTQIGPYQVLREIGRGGMGVVYLAHDLRLDRHVAIKALPDHLSSDADRLARFQREAKVLASLNHPSIAAIYGLEESAGHQYLILEYVDGETLDARLSRGAMPVDEALDVARHMAEALEAAHEKGVVHRDLKPGNVIVTSEGLVKVLDFGLARSGDASPSTSAGVAQADSPTIQSPAPIHSPTIPGAIMGTAGYMSPEQARGKNVDKRSDIFSFGCVLYEMLTGSGPFAGETVTDSLGAILHREPDWSLLPPTTPPRIRELLANCVVKDRRNRLHDIGDARLALDRALSAREWTDIASSPAIGRNHRDAARLIAAGLAGVALASIAWLAVRARTAQVATSSDGGMVVRLSVDAPPDCDLWEVAISPDGRAVFLGAERKSADSREPPEFHAYVRNLDSFTSRLIPESAGANDACCSADGRFFAMVVPPSPNSPRQRIIKGPTDGTSPAVSVVELPADLRADSIAWPPGEDLFALQRGSRTIVRVNMQTGTIGKPIPVVVPGVNGTPTRIHPLPGHTHLLVDGNAYGERGFVTTVGALDVATGEVRTLITSAGSGQYVPTGHLLFTRNDTLLAVPFDLATLSVTGGPSALVSGLRTHDSWTSAAFSISNNGTLVYIPGGVQGAHRTLVTVGVEGKTEPWYAEPRSYNLTVPPCVSPDDSRVAIVVSNASAIDEIWIVEPQRKTMQRLITLPHADAAPLGWMPDGERLIYSRFGDPPGDDGVYLVRADGSEPPVKLLSGRGRRSRHDVGVPLPDGSAIIIDALVDGQCDLVLVPTVGAAGAGTNAPPKTLVHGAPLFFGAAVSDDGKLLAYATRDGDTNQVYVCTMSTDGELGPRIQASRDGGGWPRWRTASDGKRELLYLDNSGRCLSSAVTTEPRLRIEPAIVIADASDVPIGIANNGAILSDGRILGVLHGDEEVAPKSACLVQNFFDEIRRKMAEPASGK